MSTDIERFDQLGLSAPLLQALEAVGYETPSPIQAACIPHLLAGRDLLGEAQTGTGKTAAFALPLLQRLDLADKRPQVLVLTPTRELAIQVAEAFQSYARNLPGFHVMPIYGGQSMVVQLRQLQRGAHVVVGTPGRVMDHLERKSLSLAGLRTLVLDEADEMLRMGFIDDVEWILDHTPPERQTALFSATMPSVIRRVAHKHLREPQEIKVKSATSTVTSTRQRYWQVSGLHKLDALTRILETEEDLDAALVFVRTKTSTVELAEKLQARGYNAAALNGDMVQALRERTIEQLKNKNLDIVIATDVAARGLDVPRISHVINYDIPYDTEAYVHRIGRTGRAGRTGNAILFVAPREKRMLRMIEGATRQPIEPMQLPSMEAVANRRVTQFKQEIVDVIESQELAFFVDVVGQIENEKNIDARRIAAALAWMAQRERPLQVAEKPGAKGAERILEAPTARAPDDVAIDKAPRTAKVADDKWQEMREEKRETRETKREEKPASARTGSRFGKQRYRLAAGRDHGVTPKDIVGAIANEAGIESRFIGQIDLFDDYSTVELPDDIPDAILQLLKRTRLRGRPMDITLFTDDAAPKSYAKKRWDAGDKPPRAARPAQPFKSESGKPPSFAKKPFNKKRD